MSPTAPAAGGSARQPGRGLRTDPARGSGHTVPTSPRTCVGPEWRGHRALALTLPRRETSEDLRVGRTSCQVHPLGSASCVPGAVEIPCCDQMFQAWVPGNSGGCTRAALRGPLTLVYGADRRRSHAQPARAPSHSQSRDMVPTSVRTWKHTEEVLVGGCWCICAEQSLFLCNQTHALVTDHVRRGAWPETSSEVTLVGPKGVGTAVSFYLPRPVPLLFL